MGLFRVENDLLVIDKDETRAIPEFKVILERDKGAKGDTDGRKKFRAFKEFLYIYYVADFESFLSRGGYNEKEKHKLAIKEAGLEEDFKVDNDIKNAIEKYSSTQLLIMPALSTLSTIIKGLKTADKISQNIVESIESVMDSFKEKKKAALAENAPWNPGDDAVMTSHVVGQLEYLLKISNNIPKTIKTLEEIEERLAREKSGVNLGRGGKKIGNRADPK